jgi:cell division protein FtsW (lipid II flippase)
MKDWRNTVLPAAVPTLVFIALIVFQPDLGTAIACAAITGCVCSLPDSICATSVTRFWLLYCHYIF